MASSTTDYVVFRINLNKTIDVVFQKLLSTTGVGIDFAFVDHVFAERLEIVLAGFDLFADAAVPARVTIVDEFLHPAISPNGSGNL